VENDKVGVTVLLLVVVRLKRDGLAASEPISSMSPGDVAERKNRFPAPRKAGLIGRVGGLRRRLIPSTQIWRLLSWGVVACTAGAVFIGLYWSVWVYKTRELRAVERLSADLHYELPLETVKAALSSLQVIVGRSDNPAVINTAVGALKRLVVRQADTTDKGRQIRRRAIEAIKSLRRNDLTKDFSGDDLKGSTSI
jgi:uncharacterized membrane protein